MRLSLLLAVCSACVAACGSDKDPVAQPATDSGTQADTPVAGSQSFLVLDGAKKPVADANIAIVDAAGAVLASGKTGADGVAKLENFAFSDEVVFVTSWKQGYEVGVGPINKTVLAEQSAVLGRKTEDPALFYLLKQGSMGPKLSGTVTGLADGSTLLIAPLDGTIYQGTATKYSVNLKPGFAGHLNVVEFVGTWAGREVTQTFSRILRFDHPAITMDTTLDLDLSKGAVMPMKKVMLKYEITDGNEGPLGGDTQAYGFVLHGEVAKAFVGAPSKTTFAADGSTADVEMTYGEPASMGTYLTVARIHRPDGAYSERLFEGAPKEGQIVKDWDMPLGVTATRQAYADTFTFEGVPKGAAVLIAAQKPNGDSTFRAFISPSLAAKGSIKLPPLPAEARALLPAAAMPVRFITAREWINKGDWATKATTSRSLQVTL